MRILELEIENFKKIGNARIVAHEHVNSIGGKNAAGKSSTLDAIISVLCGKKNRPAYPLKKGAKSGSVKIKFDGDSELHQTGLTAELTYDDKGKQTLVVMSDDGFEAPSPQGIMDALYTVGFDPLRFTRLSGKEQVDELKKVVGLDFSEQEKERDTLYRERTQVNNQGKALKARVEGMARHPDAPAVELDVSALMDEQKRRQAVNAANTKHRNRVQELIDASLAAELEVKNLDSEIARLMDKLAAAKSEFHRLVDEAAKEQQNALALKDEPADEIEEQIRNAGSINRKVAENKLRAEQEAELQTLRERSEELTGQINQIDADKAKALEEAKWPVPGLGFDSDGVTLNGLPFEQASSSQQLKVSTAIGMALNPRLKVLIIRDGSLLDDNSLRELCDEVKANDYQLWIERVAETPDEEARCTLVIEDGSVKSQNTNGYVPDGAVGVPV